MDAIELPPQPGADTPLATVVGVDPKAPTSDGMPFTVEEVPDDVQTDEVVDPAGEIATDTPAVETDEETETPETDAPKHLMEFRAEGKLNEEQVEEVLKYHGARSQTLADIEGLLGENVELRTAYAKALKAKGVRLTPEYEALATKPIEPPKPAKPVYTMAAIQAKYNELAAQGMPPAKLQEFWDYYVVQPREEARTAELAAEKKRIADEAAQRTQQQVDAQAAKVYQDWVNDATKSYATLIKRTPNGSFTITDKATAEMYQTVRKQLGETSTASIKDVLELALLRLGRLGKKAPTQVAAPARKPAILTAAKKQTRPAHMWAPEYDIKSS